MKKEFLKWLLISSILTSYSWGENKPIINTDSNTTKSLKQTEKLKCSDDPLEQLLTGKTACKTRDKK